MTVDPARGLDDALAGGTELLEALFGEMPMGVAVFDRDLVLRQCNPTWAGFVARYGQLAADEVTPGKTFWDCYPGTEDQVMPVFAEVLSGVSVRYESTPLHVDGVRSYWDVAFSPLWKNDQVAGLIEMATDMTDRQRVERELQRREAILGAVSFAAQRFLESEVSWETSIQSVLAQFGEAAQVSRVYIFENHRGCAEPTASQRHEWVGPGVSSQMGNPDLIAVPYVDVGFDRIAEWLAKGEVVTGDVDALPADARPVLEAQGICSIALVPVFVDDSWWGFIGFDDCVGGRHWSPVEIDALQAAARTLSSAIARERADDLLRERDAQYRRVFESTGDGLVITDPDGNLVEANAAFYGMHGYEPDELVGRHAFSWIHSSHHEFYGPWMLDTLAGRHRYDGEAVDVRKDGTQFPVNVRGSVFTLRGRPHVLAVVRDDTERARAFRLLEQRVNALARIAESLTVSQPLPETLEELVASILAASPAVAASIYILDAAADEIRTFVCQGQPEGYVDTVRELWRAGVDVPTADALRDQELLVVRGAVQRGLGDPRLAPLHPHFRRAEWDTVALVPLDSLGRSLGSLNVYYRPGVDPTEDEIVFLRAVADQGAVAVENTRLLDEAQSKAGLEERQRLARELHDSVSQALYGIALGARTARTLVDRDPSQLVEPLDYVLSLAEAGMAEMRALIFELRPEALVSEGLTAALDKQAAAFRSRHRLDVRVTLSEEPDLPLPQKEALYRVAQEALHNTVKHARAGRIDLRLGSTGGRIVLEVRDDGIGFDPAEPVPGHFGLQTMRERLAAHRGTLQILSRPGSGTVVRAAVPAVSEV